MPRLPIDSPPKRRYSSQRGSLKRRCFARLPVVASLRESFMPAAEITFNVKKSKIEDVKEAIAELEKDAKKAKNETALTAVKSLEKQVDSYYKNKSSDKTSDLKDLFKQYNSALAAFLESEAEEEEGEEEKPKKWSVKTAKDLFAGGVLEGSETSKFKSWVAAIPSDGPMKAADNCGISCTPLKGGEYHVYLGKKNRVYFTSDEKKKVVSLLRTGHD
jgi:hypothetical protein